MQRYNPKEIEPKWQKAWEEQDIYRAVDGSDKPKKYVLEFFPYPSGAAMHVGHVRNYTIGDVISRFYRMQGYNLLHPMGWDAFGLPAENYAIKTGISPRQAIDENTAKFKQQLTQMGFSHDWSREIDSTDPAFYKWTQWFFLMLYRRGLAYQQESLQWWCPVDKTVLANEQVEAGKCWRCGSEVEKKSLKQWFFKITDYADRLDKDLDDVNWTDSIKSMQRNWIGRSQGAEIDFKIENSDANVTVFTTRPDTLFGVTFMVVAPEHPLLDTMVTREQRDIVAVYVKGALAKSDVERQETNREKTGVFTGSYAINPINGEKLPVWVADYVLGGYGTGAIMAVPAHDERDYEFAAKFKLPIVQVIEPETGKKQGDEIEKDAIVAIVRNPRDGKILMLDWGPRKERYGGHLFIGGGVEGGEDIVESAIREIAEETGYTNVTHKTTLPFTVHSYYFSNVKNKNYYARMKGLLFDLESDERTDLDLDEGEKNKFTLKWIPAEQAGPSADDEGHKLIYEALSGSLCYHGEGVMVNSGAYDGMASSEAREKIVQDLLAHGKGREKVNHKMRDWLISRQRYWGAPIPIIHCPKDGAVAVPDDQLPVVLPDMDSFEPSGDGRSPLGRVDNFVQTTCPTCNGPAERETDTMDGFACSSWYFLRFADPKNSEKAFDKQKAAYWLPVDDYIGGAEHAVMHLLYARFWTKVMHDEGLIDFTEPFKTLRNQGMILAPDGQKMSKSKGNTITPDEIISQGYGADSIRVMELFIGPWNQSANWSVEGMGGSFRFLQRVWTLVNQYVEGQNYPSHDADELYAKEIRTSSSKTIKKVTGDIHQLGFNTAIAALMEYVNELYRLQARAGAGFAQAAVSWRAALQDLVKLLAPFAPHISEELWHALAVTDDSVSVHLELWPEWEESLLQSDTLKLAVQVNGKLRGEIEVSSEATEEEIIATAASTGRVAGYLEGKTVRKTIYVPKRMVSFVVS